MRRRQGRVHSHHCLNQETASSLDNGQVETVSDALSFVCLRSVFDVTSKSAHRENNKRSVTSGKQPPCGQSPGTLPGWQSVGRAPETWDRSPEGGNDWVVGGGRWKVC